MSWSLGAIAEAIGAGVVGDPQLQINDVADLTEAGDGHISFLSNARFRQHLCETSATAVILQEEHLEDCPVAALVSDNPYLDYARVATLLHPFAESDGDIHRSAVIHPDAELHETASVGPCAVIEAGAVLEEGVIIGPGCIVGANSRLGAKTHLVANVTVCHGSLIGSRVMVHPGAVIGSDGFGLANDKGRWVKIPQLGRAVIGDDVEIGANTTVDRGALKDTEIADGAKVDNLVQVAHNVKIGENSAIAGCVGIAGSAEIGRSCTLAGGVGVVGHLKIGDNVHVTGMSMVTHSLKQPGVYSAGTPLDQQRKWLKNSVRFKQLDDMARKLARLEKRLAELEDGND